MLWTIRRSVPGLRGVLLGGLTDGGSLQRGHVFREVAVETEYRDIRSEQVQRSDNRTGADVSAWGLLVLLTT